MAIDLEKWQSKISVALNEDSYGSWKMQITAYDLKEIIQALEQAQHLIQYNTTSDNGKACKKWLQTHFPTQTKDGGQ